MATFQNKGSQFYYKREAETPPFKTPIKNQETQSSNTEDVDGNIQGTQYCLAFHNSSAFHIGFAPM